VPDVVEPRTGRGSGVRGVDDVGSRRWDAFAVVVLLAASAATWLPRLAGPLDLRYDAGAYYILSTALAAGRGYRLLNEPGAIQAIQYPPLLSLFGAAHQWLVGSADPAVAGHALRCSYAVLSATYVLVAYAFLRRRLTSGWALVGGLLVALHLQLIWLSDLFFAELPFALVALAFLLAAERADRRGIPGVCASAAYLLRSAGVGVFAAWAADAVVRLRFRDAIVRGAVALVPILAWQLYIVHVQHGPEYQRPAYAYQRAPYQYYNVSYAENMSYLDTFAPERGRANVVQLIGRVAANVERLPVALGASVSVDAAWLHGIVMRVNDLGRLALPLTIVDVLLGTLGIACLAGQLLLLADGARLVPLYWLGSLLLIAITPWELQFGRYLMPLAPVTVLGLLTALTRLRWPVLRRTVAAAVVVMLAAQIYVATYVFARQHPQVGDHRLFFYDENWAAHDAGIAWLRTDASPDAIVATSTPFWLHLATDLRAVLPPFEADPTEAERLLESVPIEYLMIDELDFVDVIRRYAAPVVTAFPSRWRLVYGEATSGARIYRRVHPE
jgi:hypothetical protein